MISGAYHVEFLTWNTEVGGDQGIDKALRSNLTGENFGHASVEISFPYIPETNQWVTQYCKGIKLYEPQEEAAKDERDSYLADVPVYYTTLDGTTIYNPELFAQKNPDESIVTHVYLSLTAGGYAAQRDERDPFKGLWKRSFALQTMQEDRVMEIEGADYGFRRGYDGVQDVQLRKEDKLGDQYIVLEPILYQHNLAPNQVKYHALNPMQRNFLEFLSAVYSKMDMNDEKMKVHLNEVKESAINFFGALKEDADISNELDPFFEKYPIASGYYGYHKKRYCLKNGWDLNSLNEEQEKAILENFKEELPQLVDVSLKYFDYIHIHKEIQQMDYFRPFVDLLEKEEQTMQDLFEDLDSIQENLKQIYQPEESDVSNEEIENRLDELMERHPLLKVLYNQKVKIYWDLSKEKYLEKYLNQDVKNYLMVREQLQNEKKNASMGGEPNTRVVLPIADIETKAMTYQGHPAGLNVHDMLKSLQQTVTSREGYALKHNNCSDFVQAIGYAGAPDSLKHLFTRQAMGIASTPQVVANGAMQYAQIINDEKASLQSYKVGFFQKWYIRQEQKSAKTVKKFEKLNVKIKTQDEIIEKIISKKEKNRGRIGSDIYKKVIEDKNLKNKYFNNESRIIQKMAELYSQAYLSGSTAIKQQNIEDDYTSNGKLYQLAYDALLKEAIYEYCDKKYHENIAEDRETLEPDIKEKTGLFKKLSEKEPNPLSDSAIKAKMRELSPLLYEKRPNKKMIDEAFEKREELYLRACHTLIYENVEAKINIADPNYTSMRNERKMLASLKKEYYKEVGILVAMRAFGSLFSTPYNVSDPWYEVKELDRSSRLLLQHRFGKEASFSKSVAAVSRALLLGTIGAASALFIAPRRYLANFRLTPRRKAIAKRAESIKAVDVNFAYKTGKITEDEIIKMKMKEIFKQHLLLKKQKMSESELNAFIEKAFEAKNSLYLKAKDKVHISESMERDKESTAKHVAHHKKKEDTLFSKDQIPGSIVEIKAKDLNECFTEFTQVFESGYIPIFSSTMKDKILAKANRVEAVLNQADARFEKKFDLELKKKLDQFYRAQMVNLGKELKTDEIFRYDPDIAEKIIPDRIKRSTDPDELRAFFKEIAQIHQEEQNVTFLFEPQDIDKMQNDQLFAAVEYLSMPTYSDRLKAFEKDLLEKSLQDPPITTMGFDHREIAAFKAFLKEQCLDPQVIHILEEKGELKNLLLRLQYAEGSAKVLRKIEKIYGNADLTQKQDKRPTPIAPHFGATEKEPPQAGEAEALDATQPPKPNMKK